jgi:GR25 family glycosyltransferase involved in LPS biosynthesis
MNINDILNIYDVIIEPIKNGDISSNILNNFPIYVINIKNDVYRRAYIKNLFKNLKLNYNLIMVDRVTIENKNKWNITQKFRHLGQLGCVLSHMFCLRDAINSNYNKFIIFEDDVVFHKNFNNMIAKYLTYDLDLLMLGACDFVLKQNIINMNANNDLYFPKENALGAHANVYSLKFAKILYEHKIKNSEIIEFDKDYSLFYNNYKIGICYPNLVICELSTTNINHFFSPLLKQFHDNFISNCFMDNIFFSDYNYITIEFIKFIYKNNILDNTNVYNAVITSYIKGIRHILNKNKIENMLLSNEYTIEDLNNINLIITEESKLFTPYENRQMVV